MKDRWMLGPATDATAQRTVIDALVALARSDPAQFTSIMEAQKDLLDGITYPHVDPQTQRAYQTMTGPNRQVGIENQLLAVSRRAELTDRWASAAGLLPVGTVISFTGFGELARFLESNTTPGDVRYAYFGLVGHAMGIVHVGGGEVVVFDVNSSEDALVRYPSLDALTAAVDDTRSRIFSAYGHDLLYLHVYRPPWMII